MFLPQQEDGDDTDIAEGAFVAPRLPDGLAGVKLLVGGADEDDQEGETSPHTSWARL